MLIVEIQARQKGSQDREVIGRVAVAADGTYEFEGAPEIMNTVILDKGSPGNRLTLQHNPIRWGRNLHKAFRTGYVTAVTIEDTLPAE